MAFIYYDNLVGGGKPAFQLQTMNKLHKIPIIATLLLLTYSLYDDYYSDDYAVLLRLSVFCLSLYLGWFSYKVKAVCWLYAWIGVAIVFNPIWQMDYMDYSGIRGWVLLGTLLYGWIFGVPKDKKVRIGFVLQVVCIGLLIIGLLAVAAYFYVSYKQNSISNPEIHQITKDLNASGLDTKISLTPENLNDSDLSEEQKRSLLEKSYNQQEIELIRTKETISLDEFLRRRDYNKKLIGDNERRDN